MQLDEGMDSGPVIAQRETDIRPGETAAVLTPRLFEMGAELLAETLPRWRIGEITPTAQRDTDATVTRLLSREDGVIDWTQSADYIDRMVRAFDPWPGTFTQWGDRQLKVLQASTVDLDEPCEPGTVLETSQGIGVMTGGGILLLNQLQLEGRQRADIADFTRGYRDFVGSRLGAS